MKICREGIAFPDSLTYIQFEQILFQILCRFSYPIDSFLFYFFFQVWETVLRWSDDLCGQFRPRWQVRYKSQGSLVLCTGVFENLLTPHFANQAMISQFLLFFDTFFFYLVGLLISLSLGCLNFFNYSVQTRHT